MKIQLHRTTLVRSRRRGYNESDGHGKWIDRMPHFTDPPSQLFEHFNGTVGPDSPVLVRPRQGKAESSVRISGSCKIHCPEASSPCFRRFQICTVVPFHAFEVRSSRLRATERDPLAPVIQITDLPHVDVRTGSHPSTHFPSFNADISVTAFQDCDCSYHVDAHSRNNRAHAPAFDDEHPVSMKRYIMPVFVDGCDIPLPDGGRRVQTCVH